MNPVLVDVWRGNAVESQHRGSVAVVDARGRLVHSLGDVEAPVFPRSAIKFLQAIPFVETGAFEHFDLSQKHLSIACASHNGEAVHTDLVQDWLQHIECLSDDLACGADYPLASTIRDSLIQRSEEPQRFHHNCSGKHMGMLSTAKYLGEPVAGYQLYDSPVQQRWFSVLEELGDIRVDDLPWGYDGCGIPALAMPMRLLAAVMSKFCDADGVSAERAAAMEKIVAAVAAEPQMVAGSNRLCTALMRLTGRDVIVKTGAEGYYVAVAVKQGCGIAIKADDGSTRASQAILGATLLQLGAITPEQYQELENYVKPPLRNSRKDVVGVIKPSAEWENLQWNSAA